MAEIRDLISMATSWQAIVGVVIVYSLAPGVALRLAVKIYPKGNPRRDELIAEYSGAVPLWRRQIWVADVVVAAMFEGLELRSLDRSRRFLEYATRQFETLNLLSEEVQGLAAQLDQGDLPPEQLAIKRRFVKSTKAELRQVTAGLFLRAVWTSSWSLAWMIVVAAIKNPKIFRRMKR